MQTSGTSCIATLRHMLSLASSIPALTLYDLASDLQNGCHISPRRPLSTRSQPPHGLSTSEAGVNDLACIVHHQLVRNGKLVPKFLSFSLKGWLHPILQVLDDKSLSFIL